MKYVIQFERRAPHAPVYATTLDSMTRRKNDAIVWDTITEAAEHIRAVAAPDQLDRYSVVEYRPRNS